MIRFKIHEIKTDNAKFKILSNRLNDIISNLNYLRTNKDPKKWTSIKNEITNLKIDIQETANISLYHLQQILTKTRQTQDRISRAFAYMIKIGQLDDDRNQNTITRYLRRDSNNPFDTND